MKPILINNRKFIQNELTLEQMEAVTDLLSNAIDFDNIKNITARGIIDILTKKKLIAKVMAILLVPYNEPGTALMEIDVEAQLQNEQFMKRLPMSTVMEVVKSFLALNKSWISSVWSFFQDNQTQMKSIKKIKPLQSREELEKIRIETAKRMRELQFKKMDILEKQT